MRWVVLGLLACGSATVLRAELVFADRILELPAAPGAHAVSGVYHFKNTGSTAVKIRKVRTSCGCTTTRLSRLEVSPGEEGEIEATFKFGFAKGPLRKLLAVVLEDGTEIPLEIHTVVQDPISAKPRLLYWRKDSAPEPKRVSIELAPDLPVHLTGAASDHPNFQARIGRENGLAFLEVTPRATDAIAAAKVTLTTDYPAGQPATFTIFARVK